MLVTRDGRLREWSKGELRLYFVTFMVKTLTQSRLISGAAPLNPPYPTPLPKPNPNLLCARRLYGQSAPQSAFVQLIILSSPMALHKMQQHYGTYHR